MGAQRAAPRCSICTKDSAKQQHMRLMQAPVPQSLTTSPCASCQPTRQAMAAATREQGAPTMAVALASSLYAPPEAAVVASGGMPVAKSKRAALGSTHGSQVRRVGEKSCFPHILACACGLFSCALFLCAVVFSMVGCTSPHAPCRCAAPSPFPFSASNPMTDGYNVVSGTCFLAGV